MEHEKRTPSITLPDELEDIADLRARHSTHSRSFAANLVLPRTPAPSFNNSTSFTHSITAGSRLVSPAGSLALQALRGSYVEDSLPQDDNTAEACAPKPTSNTPRLGLRGTSAWLADSQLSAAREDSGWCSSQDAGFSETEGLFPSHPSASTPRPGLIAPIGMMMPPEECGKAALAAERRSPQRHVSVFATALHVASAAAGDAHALGAAAAHKAVDPGHDALAAVRHSYTADALPQDRDAGQGGSLPADGIQSLQGRPCARSLPHPPATASASQPVVWGNSLHSALFPAHPTASVRRPGLPPPQPKPATGHAGLPPTPTDRILSAAVQRRVLTADGAAIMRALQASYPHLQDDWAVQQPEDEESSRRPFEPLPSSLVPRSGVSCSRTMGCAGAPSLDTMFEEDEGGGSGAFSLSGHSSGLSRPGMSGGSLVH